MNTNARYMRISQMASTTGKPGRYPLSAATIWRWVKLGMFPAPVRLGPQVTAWKVEDLDAWDATKRN